MDQINIYLIVTSLLIFFLQQLRNNKPIQCIYALIGLGAVHFHLSLVCFYFFSEYSGIFTCYWTIFNKRKMGGKKIYVSGLGKVQNCDPKEFENNYESQEYKSNLNEEGKNLFNDENIKKVISFWGFDTDYLDGSIDSLDFENLIFLSRGVKKYCFDQNQFKNLLIASECDCLAIYNGSFLNKFDILLLQSKNDLFNSIIKFKFGEMSKKPYVLILQTNVNDNKSWAFILNYVNLLLSFNLEKVQKMAIYFNLVILILEFFRDYSSIFYGFMKKFIICKIKIKFFTGCSKFKMLFLDFMSSFSDDWTYCDKEMGIYDISKERDSRYYYDLKGDITKFKDIHEIIEEFEEVDNLLNLRRRVVNFEFNGLHYNCFYNEGTTGYQGINESYLVYNKDKLIRNSPIIKGNCIISDIIIWIFRNSESLQSFDYVIGNFSHNITKENGQRSRKSISDFYIYNKCKGSTWVLGEHDLSTIYNVVNQSLKTSNLIKYKISRVILNLVDKVNFRKNLNEEKRVGHDNLTEILGVFIKLIRSRFVTKCIVPNSDWKKSTYLINEIIKETGFYLRNITSRPLNSMDREVLSINENCDEFIKFKKDFLGISQISNSIYNKMGFESRKTETIEIPSINRIKFGSIEDNVLSEIEDKQALISFVENYNLKIDQDMSKKSKGGMEGLVLPEISNCDATNYITEVLEKGEKEIALVFFVNWLAKSNFLLYYLEKLNPNKRFPLENVCELFLIKNHVNNVVKMENYLQNMKKYYLLYNEFDGIEKSEVKRVLSDVDFKNKRFLKKDVNVLIGEYNKRMIRLCDIGLSLKGDRLINLGYNKMIMESYINRKKLILSTGYKKEYDIPDYFDQELKKKILKVEGVSEINGLLHNLPKLDGSCTIDFLKPIFIEESDKESPMKMLNEGVKIDKKVDESEGSSSNKEDIGEEGKHKYFLNDECKRIIDSCFDKIGSKTKKKKIGMKDITDDSKLEGKAEEVSDFIKVFNKCNNLNKKRQSLKPKCGLKFLNLLDYEGFKNKFDVLSKLDEGCIDKLIRNEVEHFDGMINCFDMTNVNRKCKKPKIQKNKRKSKKLKNKIKLKTINDKIRFINYNKINALKTANEIFNETYKEMDNYDGLLNPKKYINKITEVKSIENVVNLDGDIKELGEFWKKYESAIHLKSYLKKNYYRKKKLNDTAINENKFFKNIISDEETCIVTQNKIHFNIKFDWQSVEYINTNLSKSFEIIKEGEENEMFISKKNKTDNKCYISFKI